MAKVNYNKPKNWDGKDLKGDWDVSYKIDGIRAFISKNGVVSRNGKPLYNLERFQSQAPMDVEVFCGSWEKTVTKVKTHSAAQYVFDSEIYSLDPLDKRLFVETIYNPTAQDIEILLDEALNSNYEGLVLRQGKKWLKVKGEETYDVRITELQEGTGKYVGMLGAFMTEKGKVGTGFTDDDRQVFFDPALIGTIVEVECQGLTPFGSFRHPRFKRLRFDKD